MNNQFSTANLASQHGIQMAQHVATTPPQTSAAVLNTFYNAQQQQQQQLAAAVAAGTLYADPRQLQLSSNPVEKNYYTTTGTTLGTLGSSPRFYTTSGPATAGTNPTVTSTGTHHPNTILITNNFAHQQPQQLCSEQQRNIRIVTSAANPLSAATNANLATTAGAYQHSQHVFNLNNNKQLQHLFPQHILHQQSYQPTTTAELLQQHFATQQFPTTHQQNDTAATAIQMPQFYVSAENTVPQLNPNPKIITNITSNSVTSAGGNSATSLVGGNSNNSNSSTVVLDRINICINNLYADTSSSSSASNSLASTPAQQPSPIIPAIQHKTMIENSSSMSDMYETNTLVIDEPDSTTTATTPHTPPTTPENTPPSMPNVGNTNNHSNNNTITTTCSINSPSTSSNQNLLEKSNIITTTKQNFASVAQNIEELKNYIQTSTTNLISPPSQTKHSIPSSNTPITPPTPPSPETSTNIDFLKESKNQLTTAAPQSPVPPLFICGEDVFIKRQDGRFYLGTVIDNARNQFLIRFDDKTELWCEAVEMRKLGISLNNNNNKTSSSIEDNVVEQPMCVACKRCQPDSKVEICERCGRGYHRKCTTETSPGSQVWLCKRCAKPMKLNETSKFSSADEETEFETCVQLPYDVDSLTWDDKHRVNEEQIYCYCGKSGKFDHNMLQCCRCSNWYHTHCTQKVKCHLMRGDGFFVFCCSVCNYGEEYLRRLQLSWVDLVHLILYNLSTMKKHQHHKYHHLLKDINPFALEKRKSLPIPIEWISMPEKEFLDKIKRTLLETTERFISGKEIKRDHYFFALRTMGPPLINRIPIKPHDKLNDDFILYDLKLKLLADAAENSDIKLPNFCSDTTLKSKTKLSEDSSSHDVYDFDDTSEDEVPIKIIRDKVKKIIMSSLTVQTEEGLKKPSNKTTTATLEKMDVEDDNANDIIITRQQPEPILNLSSSHSEKNLISTNETKSSSINALCNEEVVFSLTDKNSLIVKQAEKSSRKRKAFTLCKSYDAQRLFDSSSDENSSSSSRGTSLDLIIPPPKNFLGQNNPFRIISPKKNTETSATTSSGKKSVNFGIFNTTALNFSSKLAALKSAGLFSNRSTSNLAKAAGQPRTVRTIKRRLSAKDITIGPNQEVRRKRTKRLSSNIEVISTTTLKPIPTNFFPIHAKDLLAAAAASSSTAASLFSTTQTKTSPSSFINNINVSVTSSIDATLSLIDNAAGSKTVTATTETKPLLPTHGRRLRQRPQKNSPNTSRRNSVSSSQSSNSSTSAAMAVAAAVASQTSHLQQSHEDLKQTVNKYFGIVNRIESGEQFSIRAKRQLSNGQMQYLIEWGDGQNGSSIKSQEVTSIKDTSPKLNNIMEVDTRVDTTSQLTKDLTS